MMGNSSTAILKTLQEATGTANPLASRDSTAQRPSTVGLREDVADLYSKIEAADYNIPGQHFYSHPKGFPWTFTGLLYSVFRCELLILGQTKTLWDITLLPIALFFSRVVSGLYKCKAVQGSDGNDFRLHLGNSTTPFYASGYFGWGKMCMLEPDVVADKLKEEITNLSLIAALFLTITMPSLAEPPEYVKDDYIYEFVFIFANGASVAGQLATVVVSLAILTNLNKCVGAESRVLFIKSIFNPYNGITGIIGPMLYIGMSSYIIFTLFFGYLLFF